VTREVCLDTLWWRLELSTPAPWIARQATAPEDRERPANPRHLITFGSGNSPPLTLLLQKVTRIRRVVLDLRGASLDVRIRVRVSESSGPPQGFEQTSRSRPVPVAGEEGQQSNSLRLSSISTPRRMTVRRHEVDAQSPNVTISSSVW